VINLIGDRSDSGEQEICREFLPSQGCEFNVQCTEIGNLRSVKVRRDEVTSSWFLDKIEVEDVKNSKMYSIVCNKLLSSDDNQEQEFSAND
jgi:hypothetical protein